MNPYEETKQALLTAFSHLAPSDLVQHRVVERVREMETAGEDDMDILTYIVGVLYDGLSCGKW